MRHLVNNWTFSTLGLIPIMMGSYLMLHSGYISQTYAGSEFFNWIDTPIGGLSLVLIGTLTLLAIFMQAWGLRLAMLVINGALYTMFFATFLFRELAGYHNMTWILSLGAFIATLGIAYKEARKIE